MKQQQRGSQGVAERISWEDSKRGRSLKAVLVSAAMVTLAATLVHPAAVSAVPDSRSIQIIVRQVPGAGSAPELAVEALGGEVGRPLRILQGFSATLPEDAVQLLARAVGVRAVVPDASLSPLGVDFVGPGGIARSYSALPEFIGAREYWDTGVTGEGVDVALIDTGVAPVAGLGAPDKVVNGPDLSFESQVPELRYLDTNGHGTHIASIIAGRDEGVTFPVGSGTHEEFLGIAPDAGLVNVKVGDAYGATDVSQVIAAIDWVVQHRNDVGMNIRVLNLSYGTDGTQSYELDPLTYAAEVAWRKGIVVVAAAGNEGFGSAKLNNPAYDPFVVAVGAADLGRTAKNIKVASWSSTGNGTRNPDLLAPGNSVVGLRTPGSLVDLQYPVSEDPRFLKGSGTSQAAAVVSGAAALLLEDRPNLTPDQVKALLVRSATPLRNTDPRAQGAGVIDLRRARRLRVPNAVQNWPRSTGLGSLELARGSNHLVTGDVELRGEQDIFGTPWNPAAWAATAGSSSWSGGLWNGEQWTGEGWTGISWASNTWAIEPWTKSSWSGDDWEKSSWSKNSWSASNSWSGEIWTKSSWSSSSFAKSSWSTGGWEASDPY